MSLGNVEVRDPNDEMDGKPDRGAVFTEKYKITSFPSIIKNSSDRKATEFSGNNWSMEVKKRYFWLLKKLKDSRVADIIKEAASYSKKAARKQHIDEGEDASGEAAEVIEEDDVEANFDSDSD